MVQNKKENKMSNLLNQRRRENVRQTKRKKSWHPYLVGIVMLVLILLMITAVIVLANWRAPRPITTTPKISSVVILSPTLVPSATQCPPEEHKMLQFLAPANLSMLASEVKPPLWIEGDPTNRSTWKEICPRQFMGENATGVVFVDSRDGKTKLMPPPSDGNSFGFMKETVIFTESQGTPVPFKWEWYELK